MEERTLRYKIESDDNAVKSTREEIKRLKSEMLQTEDVDTFNKLALEAGNLETEIKRVEDAVVSLSGSGSELTKMQQSLGRVGASLISLDFAAAAEEAGRLASISRSMNFGTAIKSVKDLGSTFATLGKALLTNPFFLLVAIIGGIVIAIYTLLDELGLIDKVFEAIGKMVDWVIQKVKDLLDWFGLTSYAADEAAEREAKAQEKRAEAHKRANREIESAMSNNITLMKSQGATIEEIEDAEIELAKTRALNFIQENKQNIARLKTMQALGVATTGQLDELSSLTMELDNLITAVEIRENEVAQARKERARKRWQEEKKANEEIAKIEQQRIDNTEKFLLDIERKRQDILDQSIEDEIAREEQQKLRALERQQEDIDFTQMTVEAKLEWDEWYEEERLRIEDEANSKRLEKEQRLQDELLEQKKLAAQEEQRLKEEEKQAIQQAEQFAISSAQNLVNSLVAVAENGSAAQKALAMTNVLVSQAQAIAGAINIATQAASVGGPAAPFIFAGVAASVLGSVASTIAQAKSILGVSGGGSGGGSVGGGGFATPNMGQNIESTPTMNFNQNEQEEANAGSGVNVVTVVDYFDIANKGKGLDMLQNKVTLA